MTGRRAPDRLWAMLLRSHLLTVLGLVLAASPAAGWGARAHLHVVGKALEGLSRSQVTWLLRHRRALFSGALGPDRRGEEAWMPSLMHVQHVKAAPDGTRKGEAFLARDSLVRDLRDASLSSRTRVLRAGMLAHVLSDLAQPLHTDGRDREPRESEIHGTYEADVDRALSLGWLRGGPASTGDLTDPLDVAELVLRSNLDYPILTTAYLAGGRLRSVEAATRRGIDRAIQAVSSAWAEHVPREPAGLARRVSDLAGRCWRRAGTLWTGVLMLYGWVALRQGWNENGGRSTRYR